MKLIIRLLIVVVLVAGVILLAGEKGAWAGSRQGSDPVAQQVVSNQPALDKPNPGSVKPPPPDVIIPVTGVTSVGGVSTLNVQCLPKDYYIAATLWNNAFAIGKIPETAGDALAPITVLRVFYKGELVSEIPAQPNCEITICYAVPPEKTGQIYFYDFYGPRFGRNGSRDWVAEKTTVTDNIACAPASATGAYALIGK
jgi:hypothetical protein